MVDGSTVTGMECAKPCEIVKIMSFIDTDKLRKAVHVERIVNQPGTLAHAVFEDALSGKLRQYGIERGGRRYQMWVESKLGFMKYLIKKSLVQNQV